MNNTEKRELCIMRADMCRTYAKGMDLLNKPNNAYWFKKAEIAYGNGFYYLGSFFKWFAERDLYKSDWRYISLLLQYKRI